MKGTTKGGSLMLSIPIKLIATLWGLWGCLIIATALQNQPIDRSNIFLSIIIFLLPGVMGYGLGKIIKKAESR